MAYIAYIHLTDYGDVHMDKTLTGRFAAVCDNLVYCELDGQDVILNLDNGIYYGLDPVGSFIWNLIQSPKELIEIKDQILVEYDVDDEKCKQDLFELLNDLAAKGLVEISDRRDA
jgi:hypothetical protein